MTHSQLPLADIKVIEFSTMITASLSSKMLAELGAEVIKCEPLAVGDIMRYIGTEKNGMSALFANCNHGKQSLELNLQTEQGKAIAIDLIQQADVLIHNYRPGVMDRLGLGAEAMRKLNPQLIYASVSGFGEQGPYSSFPAYDHIIQATAGFCGVQSSEDKAAFMHTLICDKVTAYTINQAIMTALLTRQKTGEGAELSVSMLEACMYFLWPDGMMNHTLLDDDVVTSAPLSKTYTPVETQDGFIIISAASDGMWQGIFRAMGCEELLQDERFATMGSRLVNIADLRDILYPLYRTHTTDDLITKLQQEGVPCAPCLSQQQAIDHEQTKANTSIDELQHPSLGKMRVLKPPVRMDGVQRTAKADAPLLGADTIAILSHLGYDQTQIATLQQQGVIS